MPTNVILGANTANTACASHSELLHNINKKKVVQQQQQQRAHKHTPMCITAARLMQHRNQIFHYTTRQPDCTSHT